MANIFDKPIDWFANKIAGYMTDKLGMEYNILGRYYGGEHRPQLKTDPTRRDDNIILNFIGLAVDRSVSRLFRGGMEFNLPENATAQQEYIDKVWELNKKQILCYQLGLHGSVFGTPFIKIRPDELRDPYTGELYPKLVPLSPMIVRVETDSQDYELVEKYVICYTVNEERAGMFGAMRKVDITYREVTRREQTTTSENEVTQGTWTIERYEKVGGAQERLIETISWDYDFPPILHWKNLPSIDSPLGDRDIDDAINAQDHENFAISNTGKIIKYHASPRTVGTGFSAGDLKVVDNAVNTMYTVSNADAKVYNLEMQTDLASSRAFAQDLRQAIFDISREVDLSSIADKLGALTNFGLNVLYGDAQDKNKTKRALYGDAFKELNRRLLVLKNFEGEKSNPGEVKWGEAMIVNVKEEMETDKIALDMKIVDEETIYERYKERYGKSWEDIQKALQAEKPTPPATPPQPDNSQTPNNPANITNTMDMMNGKQNA